MLITVKASFWPDLLTSTPPGSTVKPAALRICLALAGL